MFTIKLVEQSNGKPAAGKRVSIGFPGIFSGGVSKNQYSDSNGETHWDYDPCEGTVYVEGQDEYTGRLEGRVLIYI